MSFSSTSTNKENYIAEIKCLGNKRLIFPSEKIAQFFLHTRSLWIKNALKVYSPGKKNTVLSWQELKNRVIVFIKKLYVASRFVASKNYLISSLTCLLLK